MSQSEYIHEDEQYWFDRREFLEKAGYALRPKFKPGYVRPPDVSTRSLKARHSRPSIMDATRTVDSAPILLKYICKTSHPYESSIGQFFSEPQRAADPRNHCIPILDVLPDPEEKDREILVMPRFTGLYAPPFDTVGEVLDCFRQLFEGLAYMHENGVAHRDCALLNVVVDPSKLYPQGNHPVRFKMNPAYTAFSRPTTRTRCWPRYYLIDFGLSRQYSIDGSSPPREEIIRGADKSPPEHDLSRLLKPCNPFPTDVYYLGNMLKENFIEYTVQRKGTEVKHRHAPLDFLRPLVDDMTDEDPARRPTIWQVSSRFNALCSSLMNSQLRKPGQSMDFLDSISQKFRQIQNIVQGIPPLPSQPMTQTGVEEKLVAFYTM